MALCPGLCGAGRRDWYKHGACILYVTKGLTRKDAKNVAFRVVKITLKVPAE